MLFHFSLGHFADSPAKAEQYVHISESRGEMHVFLPFDRKETIDGIYKERQILVLYRGSLYRMGGVHLHWKNGKFYFFSSDYGLNVWFDHKDVVYSEMEENRLVRRPSSAKYYLGREISGLTDAGKAVVAERLLFEFNLFYQRNKEEFDKLYAESMRKAREEKVFRLKEKIAELEAEKEKLEKELQALQ